MPAGILRQPRSGLRKAHGDAQFFAGPAQRGHGARVRRRARIINPNRQALALEGVSYTIAIEGHEPVNGVARDLPVIEGYSEEVITLTASANLLAGIRLVGDLMQASGESLDYEFEAKLDPGLFPAMRIRESGNFDITGSPR